MNRINRPELSLCNARGARLLAAAVLLAALPAVSGALGFTGRVTKEDGTTALSGVLVQVINPADDSVVTSFNTDGLGYYAVPVGAGTYHIQTGPAGYFPVIRSSYVVTAGDVNVDFALQDSGEAWRDDFTSALAWTSTIGSPIFVSNGNVLKFTSNILGTGYDAISRSLGQTYDKTAYPYVTIRNKVNLNSGKQQSVDLVYDYPGSWVYRQGFATGYTSLPWQAKTYQVPYSWSSTLLINDSDDVVGSLNMDHYLDYMIIHTADRGYVGGVVKNQWGAVIPDLRVELRKGSVVVGEALSDATGLYEIWATTGAALYNIYASVPSGAAYGLGGLGVTGRTQTAAQVTIDTTPPAAVTDLTAVAMSSASIYVSWTAPGDDGTSYTLNNSSFSIQYSSFAAVAWSTAAAQVTIPVSAVSPGSMRNYTVGGLAANTTYYFRNWTRDAAGNFGGQSNMTAAATMMETPESVYIDEVSTWSITASAYASTFTALGMGLSGVNLSTGTAYGPWVAGGGVWTDRPDYPGGRRYGAAAAALGGKLYVMGGSADGIAPATVGGTLNYEYDPAFNTWVSRADIPTKRFGLAAAAAGDRIYVLGGYTGSVLSGANEEYDPAANAWRARAPMPTPRDSLAAAALDGKIYAVGGRDGVGPSDKNEVYDPARNKWTTGWPMTTARRNLAAAAVSGRIYAVGGYNAGEREENEAYNPGSNQWTTMLAMPTPRHALAAGAIGGKLYAVAGYNGAVYLNNNDVYDPARNAWASQSPIPMSREGMTAGVLNGELYLVGGFAPGVPGGVYLSSTSVYFPGVTKVISGLQPNMPYSLKAKARNRNGMQTPETMSYSAYTLAVATVVAGPTFTQVYSGSVTVTWSAGSPPNGPGARYRVEASTMPDFSSDVRYNEASGATTLTLDWLDGSSTYYFRVQAYNFSGASDYSWTLLGSTLTAKSPPEGFAISTMSPAGQNISWSRSMARDSKGGLYIVYPKKFGSYYRIFLSSSSDNGNTWTASAFPIENSGLASDQSYPSLAIDSKDRLHMAWGSAAPVGCLYSSAPAPGAMWSPYVQLPSGSISEGPFNIAVDSKDGVHIVWSGAACGGAGCHRIRYSSRTETGPWTPYAVVNEDGNQAAYPALAIDSRDGVNIVVRRGMTGGVDATEMIAYSSRTSGGAWSAWTSVYSDIGKDQEAPALTIDSNGRLFAAWSSPEAGYPQSQVKYSVMPPGFPWSAAGHPQLSPGFQQHSPAAAADALGNVYLLWSSSDAVNPAINLKGSVYDGSAWKTLDKITDETSGKQIFAGGRWAGWRNNGGDINFAWYAWDGLSSTATLRVLRGQDVPMSPGWSKVSWPLPAGCGYAINVEKEAGTGDFSTIQGALGAIPVELSTTACVVVRDTQPYSEQVTVQGFSSKDQNAGYRVTIMSDPTFISSAPAVIPPMGSFAGFRLLAASVTVQGINVVSTNSVSYGILASSDNIKISSVNIVSGNMIALAGIFLSTRSEVSDSSITVQSAYGLRLAGGYNTVSRSTMTSTSSGGSALYAGYVSSNSVSNCYIHNPSGNGLRLEYASFNDIDVSTITSGFPGLYAVSIDFYSSSNSVRNSYISNPPGTCAQLANGSSDNTISQSTFTNSAGGYPAVSFFWSDGNLVTGSSVTNRSGPAVVFEGATRSSIRQSLVEGANPGFYALRFVSASSNTAVDSDLRNPNGDVVMFESNADSNVLSRSTMTSNSAGRYGVYYNASKLNTILDSYIQASTAVFSSNSGAAIIRGSTLRSVWPDGVGLSLQGSTQGVFLGTSTVGGGSNGAAIYLAPGNVGKIELASSTVNGGKYGLLIGDQAGTQVVVSSLTFQALSPGATAINFLGGTFVTDFGNVAFNTTAIDVNVNGGLLSDGSLVRFPGAAGPRYGAVYEYDPANPSPNIYWDTAETSLVGPADGSAGVSRAAGLYARAPAAATAAQYWYQVATEPMFDVPYSYDQSVLQNHLFGAFSGQDGTMQAPGDAYLYSSTAAFVFHSTTTPLGQNSFYYWRARAKTPEAGEFGPWSSTAAFTTGESANLSPVNNLAVTEVALSSPTASGATVSFKLRENNVHSGFTGAGSPYNTADWIFVKFSTGAGADGTWKHATLGPGGGSGAGGTLAVASDNKGAFINHSGSYALWQTTANVVWNYAADGVVSGQARVKVFAISMVKVPQGGFIYDAGGIGGAAGNNYGGGSQLAVNAGDRPTGAAAGWPSGYESFYVMRYELTQGLYADFLNTVHSSTAAALYASDNTYGHTMTFNSGNMYGNRYGAANRFAAKNFLSTNDAWSFLSWAALRPMTEMEFEKAARDTGSDARTYPWGSTEPGTETYTPPNEGGTHVRNFMSYGVGGTTLKVLASGRYMSGDAYRTPEQTGASPYGIADLAGNLYEQVINCSHAIVPPGGNGTEIWPSGWPADNSGAKGVRGGNLNYSAFFARVSDRTNAVWTDAIRYFDIGVRGARAP